MNADQPPPAANASKPIWELVIADIHERDRLGRHRYGTPLQAGNGRDALVDAYQEALDLCVYLRQAIEERDCADFSRDKAERLETIIGAAHCWLDEAVGEDTDHSPDNLRLRVESATKEIDRLNVELHANRCHPDWSYIVVPAAARIPFGDRPGIEGWERCREAENGSGDHCWRRKKCRPSSA